MVRIKIDKYDKLKKEHCSNIIEELIKSLKILEYEYNNYKQKFLKTNIYIINTVKFEYVNNEHGLMKMKLNEIKLFCKHCMNVLDIIYDILEGYPTIGCLKRYKIDNSKRLEDILIYLNI